MGLHGVLSFIMVEEIVINRKSSWRRTGFCTGGEIYTVFHEESESEVKNLQFFDLEAKKSKSKFFRADFFFVSSFFVGPASVKPPPGQLAGALFLFYQTLKNGL